MSSTSPIAVTGSTGVVGGMVARTLAARGLPLRLLVRDPSRAPDLPGATVAQAEYGDRSAVREALTGTEVVFMVSAAESVDRLEQHLDFVDAAAHAGVEHLVYLSFFGASPTATFTLARDHFATEEHIRRHEHIAHTFLRDNFYLDFLPKLAGDDGVIRGPAGDGRVAAVAQADVAAVAAEVLTRPAQHRNVTHDLTGPAALTLTEAAAIITERTGRTVRFHDETIEEAYQSRLRWPAEQWQYDAWVSTYTAIAAGELDGPTDTVAEITGRPPIGLRDLLAG
ncbi:NmrA family NAD(P)-binding protein [Propionibacteriaceae bacterium Y2011]